MKLTIEHNGNINDEKVEKLEDDIISLLEKHGLESLGSGYCFSSGIRDIEFRTKGGKW